MPLTCHLTNAVHYAYSHMSICLGRWTWNKGSSICKEQPEYNWHSCSCSSGRLLDSGGTSDSHKRAHFIKWNSIAYVLRCFKSWQ